MTDSSNQRYKRRQILQMAGLAAGAAALPAACKAANTPNLDAASKTPTGVQPATSSPAIATAQTGSSRVVLIRTEDRVAGVKQALDLLQPDSVASQSVFIKPNYNTADPAPAATDTAMLEALIKELQSAKAGKMTIGDRSGMADTRQAMTTKGVFKLAEQYGLEAIVLDELAAADWQKFPAEGTHWSRGFAFARPILAADAIINTCCLKTHRFGGHFTLSLKNTVGMVAKYVPGDSYNYMGELHSSPHQRLMIAEINKAYQPALVLLDGVDALVNGGPEAGKQVKAGVMIAGTDRVAVDVVAIGILRSLGTTPAVAEGSVWQLEQIRRAVELGLGARSDEQIEIVTADAGARALADQIRPLIA
ncbi:MAG TPA: DUF362 domain-containing protein [Leptolyngbyaceae cyanobacterium M33_DOE_097]|uniref:DUF362 domain-containing protein n=1 Tax=Oscillatoriales cyanobacterium SpSt-418 TaxID=2282169 RepID=A0A7C3PME6_9CYAN|nr:DUF362 domain-containing protein [Leptolyngbyaceae cyanobacterium M33_DOE_097]